MNDFEKQLQEDINQLPKSIEPEKDLWTGIDIALNKEYSKDGAAAHTKKAVSPTSRNSSWNSAWNNPWALAASFAIIAFVSWFGFQSQSVDKVLEPDQLVTLLEAQHIPVSYTHLRAHETV